jgi:hypothetical protein
MSFAKMILSLGALVALTTFSSPVAAHNLGRPVSDIGNCKAWYEGRVGIGVRKSKAEERAARKWRESVALSKSLGGWDYRLWRHAHSSTKHFHCEKKAGTWRCRAAGYPCHSIQQGVPPS